jgi:AAA+ ATPase superfamily predicted ATPase
MPLFDLRPKDTPASTFARDAELDQLTRSVKAGRWVAVLGPRMVGKTSLVLAAAKKFERPFLYVNLWGVSSTGRFVEAFVHSINLNRPVLARLRGTLRRLEGFSLGPGGLSLSAPAHKLTTIWELMTLISEQAPGTVYALDEVQELSNSSGPILKMLANMFNTHREVGFVFTGSKFGLLRSLLEPKAGSPLYGRSPAELTLGPFSAETSVSFLERGLAEYKMRSDPGELRALVDRSLDGIPGWLTMYGSHVAIDRLSPSEAEERTIREARMVVREELRHYLEGRAKENVWAALRAASRGAAWTEIQAAISRLHDAEANSKTVQSVIGPLEDAGFIAREQQTYLIPDPMVRGFVRSVLRAP